MKRLRTENLYTLAFISILGLLILLWFLLLFLQGRDSGQFSLFFLRFGDFWADMQNVVGYSSQLDPYNNLMYTGLQEKGYPPLAYLLTYLFSRFPDMQVHYDMNYFLNLYADPQFLVPWLLFLLLVLLGYYELIRAGKSGGRGLKVAAALVFLFSGPMLSTLERGNIVLLAGVLCLAYTQLYRSEKPILRELSLICLALAAGLKLVPAVLGLLLLRERMWKEAVRAVIYGLICFFVPFLFFKGGLSNFPLFLRNTGYMMEAYAHSGGCSIRNLLEYFGSLLHVSIPALSVWIVSLLFAAYFVYLSFTGKAAWQRLLALTLIIIAVPSFSHGYNVLYLIPAALLFLNETEHQRSDILIVVALLLIFSPLQTWLNAGGAAMNAGVFFLGVYTVMFPLLEQLQGK